MSTMAIWVDTFVVYVLIIWLVPTWMHNRHILKYPDIYGPSDRYEYFAWFNRKRRL
jgi:hypothetical protein